MMKEYKVCVKGNMNESKEERYLEYDSDTLIGCQAGARKVLMRLFEINELAKAIVESELHLGLNGGLIKIPSENMYAEVFIIEAESGKLVKKLLN